MAHTNCRKLLLWKRPAPSVFMIPNYSGPAYFTFLSYHTCNNSNASGSTTELITTTQIANLTGSGMWSWKKNNANIPARAIDSPPPKIPHLCRETKSSSIEIFMQCTPISLQNKQSGFRHGISNYQRLVSSIIIINYPGLTQKPVTTLDCV